MQLELLKDQLPTEVRDFLEEAQKKYPRVTMQNGAVYTGEMLNQKQHGFGYYQSVDMAYYFGNWLEGKRHG